MFKSALQIQRKGLVAFCLFALAGLLSFSTSANAQSCNATVSVSGSTITVNNIGGSHSEVNFLNSQWSSVKTCSSWGSSPCGNSTSYTAPSGGTYYVLIKTYTSGWSVICNETETVNVGGTPPPPPGVCSVSATVSNIQCNNRGTASGSDDTYSFRVTATITNGGAWGYDVVGTTRNMIGSGSSTTVGGGLISGGTKTYKIIDHDDPNCFTNVTVTPPAPCSSGGTTYDCPALSKNIGDSCNDGNSNTTNDKVQSDCTCAGTPVGGNTCNASITASGNKVTVSGVTGTFQQVIVTDASWNTVFSCDSWGGTACGSTPMYTASTAGTYYVTVKSYSSSWSTICNLFQTVTLSGGSTGGGCNNVTSGGQINGAQSQCGSYDPSVMGNAQSPSGGSGTIEYLWLKSTSGCPTSVTQAISGASGATYNPGTISQTTWYVRCSRRSGCSSWFEGESNCIKKEVRNCPPTFDCPGLSKNIGDSCNDGNSNTTNDKVQSNCTCAGTPVGGSTCNATITASGNKVTVSGVTGTYQQVIVTDASWNTVFSCDSWGGTACGSTPMYTAPTTGSYNVTVKSYTSGWSTICNLFETVTLTGGTGGTGGGCDNVTNGGQISGAQSVCGSYDPTVISSTSTPSGGSGALEYIWLRSTSGCPNSVNQAIPGATGATYNPGYISQTTWYRRCSRRAGCSSWFEGESNCIRKEVRSCGATACATRTVWNARGNCGSGEGYGFFAQDWIYGAGGLSNNYDFQGGSFVENTDGTARLTGTAVNNSNANVSFAVDVTFSGRTNSGAGKSSATCNINPQIDWYFYTSTTGTLTGQGAVAGAVVNLTRDGDPFQVGTGANLNDKWTFGASGWLLYTIVRQPNNSAIQIQGGNRRLDINIRLSGNASPCAPYTSRQVANNTLDVAVKYDQVELAWTNDTGYKNDLFEIERSKDGNNWESIGAVEPLSLDDTPKFYRSNDANPFEGFNYYRVKVTYLDGSEDFTETKRVTIADVEDFGIFPNPAQETVNVSLKGYEGKDIEIQVVNQFGAKVQSVRLNNVTDSTHQLELNTVQNGIYSLWIFTDGRRPVSKKMIVNKMY